MCCLEAEPISLNTTENTAEPPGTSSALGLTEIAEFIPVGCLPATAIAKAEIDRSCAALSGFIAASNAGMSLGMAHDSIDKDTIEAVLPQRRAGWLRTRLLRFAKRMGLARFLPRNKGAGSTAFTTAFVALAAKMAVADGVAVKAEAEAFEKFLEAGPQDCARIRILYDIAKTDTLGFEAYAGRINALLAAEPGTKRHVFDCLMYIACADGVLHPAEDHFLREVATIFGYSEARFRRIKAMFVHDPESPYAILDVSPEASDTEIKAQYRKLVQRNHPDRLIAEGAPAGVIKAATVKLAAINAAYEAIQSDKTRGRRA